MSADLEPGDLVRVANPKRGAVVARIVHTATPAELPALPHRWDELKAASVRRILQSWAVDHLALIEYRYGNRDVAFFALEIAGNWYDLKRQALTITREITA